MSVRKGDRTQGRLEVLNRARDLTLYSIRTCRNEKLFPKSQRWVMSNRIVNTALDAQSCIKMANSVPIGEGITAEDDYRYRHSLQMQAHADYGALYTLVDLSYNLGYIDDHKTEVWTDKIYQTDEKLQSWMRANKESYLRKNQNGAAACEIVPISDALPQAC